MSSNLPSTSDSVDVPVKRRKLLDKGSEVKECLGWHAIEHTFTNMMTLREQFRLGHSNVTAESPWITVGELKFQILIEFQELDSVPWIGQYLQIQHLTPVPYWFCHVESAVCVIIGVETESVCSDPFEFTFNAHNNGFGFVKTVELPEAFDQSRALMVKGAMKCRVEFTVVDYEPRRMHCSTDLHSSNALSDVTIVIDNQRLHVSKHILAIASPVFHSMFYGDFVESQKSEVRLYETDFQAFVTLLNVIYPCTRLPVTVEILPQVLLLADRYQMQSVLIDCDQVLLDRSSLNVWVALQLADKYNRPNVVQVCIRELTPQALKMHLVGKYPVSDAIPESVPMPTFSYSDFNQPTLVQLLKRLLDDEIDLE